MKATVKHFTKEEKKSILDGIDRLFLNLKKDSFFGYKTNTDYIIIPEHLAKEYCFFISQQNNRLLPSIRKALQSKKLGFIESEKDGIIYLYATDESKFIDCVRVIKCNFKNTYSRLVFPTNTPLRRRNKKRIKKVEEETIKQI